MLENICSFQIIKCIVLPYLITVIRCTHGTRGYIVDNTRYYTVMCSQVLIAARFQLRRGVITPRLLSDQHERVQ